MGDYNSSDDVSLAGYLAQKAETVLPNNVANNLLQGFSMQTRSKTRQDVNYFRDLIGTNKRVCVICTQRTITRGYKTMYCAIASKLSIAVLKVYAGRQRDKDLLLRLNTNKKFWLHSHCWTVYSKKSHKTLNLTEKNNNRKELDIVRGLHKVAYIAVCAFVQKEIIEKEQRILLSDLERQYKIIVHTLNEKEPLGLNNYNSYDLQKKLVKDFKDLVIEKSGETGQEILHKKGVDIGSTNTVTTNVAWTYTQVKKALLADEDDDDWPGM